MMPDHLVYRDYLPSDLQAVIGLWEVCGLTRPWNDPQRDIERKLTDSNAKAKMLSGRKRKAET